MLVKAKCIIPAWDNPVHYQPGRGPLPGGLYEIEYGGPLAKMKSNGRWVFEFDRVAASEAALLSGAPEISRIETVAPVRGSGKADKTYTCKGCGEVFDAFHKLGTHSLRCLVQRTISEYGAEEDKSKDEAASV